MTPTDAEQIALDFLMTDLSLPEEEWEWFTVLGSRLIQNSWYVVEIGVEGLPDKWVLQVYDTGNCDPSYSFVSPVDPAVGMADLAELPEAIAATIAAERTHNP
jgi:hypothetical protein